MHTGGRGSASYGQSIVCRPPAGFYYQGEGLARSLSALTRACEYHPSYQFCRSQDLSSDHAWEVAAHVFARECCAAMGLAEESPLTVTVDCGTASMPTLIKMTGVLAAKGQSWQHLAQLPLEVDLPQRFAFHSVFACPVARDQSAPDNPPMILPCGCGHGCHAAFSVGQSTVFTYDSLLTRAFISPLCSVLARCVQACTLPAVHPEAGEAQRAVFQVPLLPGMCADGCTGVHHSLLRHVAFTSD